MKQEKFEKVVEWDCDIESMSFPLGMLYGIIVAAYSFYFGNVWFTILAAILIVIIILLLGKIERRVYWKKLSSKTETTSQ